MVRLKVALALLIPNLHSALSQQYQLIQEYNASNIFEEFNFFTGPDPTNGYVQYVPFDTAADTGLIGNGSDLVYVGVDTTNVYTPGGPGRPSVRLESKMTFTEGIFVIDLTHMPSGCGVWPAFWTAGLGDWPADGEIDIIENVNEARTNNIALHATGDCSVANTTNQTGSFLNTDCNIAHDENQGCAVTLAEPFNYGAEFNANGGGVYAMEWTNTTIRIWFFPPSGVPTSLLDGYEGIPDPESFGTPSASFGGPCSDSFGEKFFNHSIIIDTTFCGGWSGGTFGSNPSTCPISASKTPIESCIDYVASNPAAMEQAYWGIRSVRVYEKVWNYEPYTDTNYTGPVLLPPPVTRPFPEEPEETYYDVYPPFETSLGSADDDTTITSTISSTTTSTFFTSETQEPLAIDSLPWPTEEPTIAIDDDFFGPAPISTHVPDTPVSEIESLLAKITTPIPISVSPKTGGVLSLGSSPEELPPLPWGPDYGEGTFPDVNEDPYADSAEDPFADAVDSPFERAGLAGSSRALTPVAPAIGSGSLPNPSRSVSTPLPSRPVVAAPASSGINHAALLPPPPPPPLPPPAAIGAGTLPKPSGSVSALHSSATVVAGPASSAISHAAAVPPPPGLWTTEDSVPKLPPAPALSPVLAVPPPLALAPPPPGLAPPPALSPELPVPPTVGAPPVLNIPPAPALGSPPALAVPPTLGAPPLLGVPHALGITPPTGGTPTPDLSPTLDLPSASDGSATPDISDVVPPELVENPPPTSVWGSMSDELKDQLLTLAAALPAVPAPVVDNVVASVPELPLAPPPTLQNVPTSQDVGGLLGLLGGQAQRRPSGVLDSLPVGANRQEIPSGSTQLGQAHVNNALSNPLSSPPSIDKSALLIPPPAGNTVQPSASLPAGTVSLALPNPPLTAPLTTMDTNQAMGGLLSFLDPATKNELLSMLLPAVESFLPQPQAANPSELSGAAAVPPIVSNVPGKMANAATRPVARDSLQTLTATLSDDTMTKLGNMILQLATVDNSTIASLLTNPWGALITGPFLPIFNQLNTISGNDKAVLLSWLTGINNASVGPSFLMKLFMSKNPATLQAVLQNIIQKAKAYADTPENERASALMAALTALRNALHVTTPAVTSRFLERVKRVSPPASSSDVIDFVNKYQTYFPNPRAISEEQFAALLGVYSGNYSPAFKYWEVNRILGWEDTVVKDFAVGYFTWITKNFPRLTKEQQDDLVDFTYHHGTQTSTKNKRHEMQQWRDTIAEQLTNGVTFDDVDASKRDELLGTFSDPNIDPDTKQWLMKGMLDDYDNTIKSFILHSYSGVDDVLHTLPTDEQSKFLEQEQAQNALGSIGRLASPLQHNTSDPIAEDNQGFLEQQIYAVCPNLDSLPMAELIGQLEGGRNSTLETALLRFRTKLETYTAKLKQCSSKVQHYAEKLKTFLEDTASPGIVPTKQNPSTKRQTPHVLSGNPSFDAFIHHKHKDDLDKWKYNSLGQSSRDALQTFVAQAARCALSNPTSWNPNPNQTEPCIASLFSTWSKVAPFLAKGIHSVNLTRPPSDFHNPRQASPQGSSDEADMLESLLTLSPSTPPTTPPTSHFVHTSPPPDAHYEDIINPKWITNIRDLAFKASTNSTTPFPDVYVHWLRDSLRRNWSHMSADVQKRILKLLRRPVDVSGGGRHEFDTPFEDLPDSSESKEPLWGVPSHADEDAGEDVEY